MAMEYDILLSELRAMQAEILDGFKNLIACEHGDILFVNDPTKELMLFHKDRWLRVPIANTIMGTCVLQGEAILISNCDSNSNFNKDIDRATGLHTRDMICEPVRQKNGLVIAVVRMINKIDQINVFDQHDQNILSSCVKKVADLLERKFQDVMKIGETFYKDSEFISVPIIEMNPTHHLNPTKASEHGKHYTAIPSNMQDFLSRMSTFGANNYQIKEHVTNKPVMSSATSLDRMKLMRRLSYARGIFGMHNNNKVAIESSQFQNLEYSARRQNDDEEEKKERKPRWVGKVAKFSEIPVLSDRKQDSIIETNQSESREKITENQSRKETISMDNISKKSVRIAADW